MRLLLHNYFQTIFHNYKLRKEDDKLRTEGKRYGKVLPTLKEAQRGTPYAKWIAYLKKQKLYQAYIDDVTYVIWKSEIYINHSSFLPSRVILNCFTKHQIEEVINYIDDFMPKNVTDYSRHKWKQIYTEYVAESSLEERKKLLARRLYHMDSENTKHHEFVGSYYPRKRLIDIIIDKLLFIKR